MSFSVLGSITQHIRTLSGVPEALEGRVYSCGLPTGEKYPACLVRYRNDDDEFHLGLPVQFELHTDEGFQEHALIVVEVYSVKAERSEEIGRAILDAFRQDEFDPAGLDLAHCVPVLLVVNEVELKIGTSAKVYMCRAVYDMALNY